MACWCKGACPVIRNVDRMRRRGRHSAAERHLKTALVDAPTCVEANIALADILATNNRGAFAQAHLQRAFDIGGMSPRLAITQARTARSRSHIKEAVQLYETAVSVAPDDPRAVAGLILCLEADGRVIDAARMAAELSPKFPESAEFRQAHASAMAAVGDGIFAAELFDKGPAMRPLDYLDRGRYRDKEGLYEQAWGDWEKARAMLREKRVLVFDRDDFASRMMALSNAATKKKLKYVAREPWPPAFPAGAVPAFVTGFPRSGTTMFETAISAHPAIVPGDELPFLGEVIDVMQTVLQSPVPYPAALFTSDFGENVAGFGLLREWYLRKALFRLGAELTERKFFTDKMPLNELHIPLILRLFPESPIFHVRRHPLDVVVSNYSHFIQHGFGYGASLESTALVYAAIDDLVLQYRELFPGKIHTVKYEAFVTDHRGELDKAFAHMHMKATPASYDFHLAPRYSRTISHRQIKEPLYDRSVGRYKNYLPQLAPVLDVLRPIIEREGYSI